MDLTNIKVSFFNSYSDVEPKEVMLLDFLTSTKHKDEVNRIRNTKTKKEKDRLKSNLPAITPSGLFHTRRLAKNLVSHSGLVQIDIDSKDNKLLDMVETKELLKNIEQVCFCSYSVSGKGLFALVPISNPEKHKEHFGALENDFKEDFNIVIDSSCKDVSRLRGYTYDPEYYVNETALVYNSIIENDIPKPDLKKVPYGGTILEGDKFFEALKIIEHNHLDITGGNQVWFEIICAIANEFGEAGRDFAHLVSQYSPLYDPVRCDKDFSRALNSNYGYGIGSFYYYLKLHINMM